MGALQKIKDFFIDLIFPKQCLGCGQEGLYLCEECKNKIDLNKKFYCVICKTPTNFSEVCQMCQAEFNLKAVWVATNYNNKILQDLIHSLKYKYLEEIALDLSDLVKKYLVKNDILKNFEISAENCLIIPVPLHKKRLLKRGFNQSELLAKNICDYFRIKKSNLLIRRVNTESQINLRRTERQKNVKNAFVAINQDDLLKNKKVILIDDVVTTGSTLNECALALKRIGFSEIFALVIAQRED
jgi:competence protein ComFC